MVRIRLKALLKRRGWSAYRLVKESRLPPDVVYRLARGETQRVDLRVLDRLCAALGCAVADLFERVPDRPHKPRTRR